jgi:tRNA(fMet)-specific endonuclease VapC
VVISYVLDTGSITLYRQGHAAVCRRVTACPRATLAVTVISAEEQLTGWYAMLRRAKRRDDLAIAYHSLAGTIAVLSRFPILSFAVPAIIRYE